MPSIIGGKKIVFDKDDFLGGLHPQYADGLNPVCAVLGSQLAGAKGFNPYRKIGYAAPGYLAQDPADYAELDNELKSGAVNGDKIYAVGNGDELVRFEIAAVPIVTKATDAGATWPYQIAGGTNSPVGEDIVVYNASVGGTDATRLFYSYNTSADWNIGMYDFANAPDDDFMTAVSAGGGDLPGAAGKDVPHPMINGKDDILYVGDRNFVHEYDGGTGANGTFSEEVLTLPRGYVVKSFARYPDYLVIFAYKASGSSSYYQGQVVAFFWNYLDLDPTSVQELNDNYVGEAFEYQGTVGVFTQGRTNDLENGGNRNSKLQLFDGSKFKTIETFDSNVPERGGVVVNGDMIMWNSEGIQYSYGSPFEGMDKVLNKLAKGSTSNTVSAMLMNPTTNFWLMSPSTLAGGRIKYFTSGNYDESCTMSTVMADGNFPDGQMGRIKSAKVVFANTATGGRTIDVQLITQAQEQVQVIENLGTVTATTIAKDFRDDPQEFYNLGLFMQWKAGSGATQAPIVKRVEVEFEPIEIINE